ncbi:site-specific integrase [Metabacillus litoralis]|uniref:tyrosine-type recombinase/integrase n=1 Tax=Metabacillus litoralis TaxID=152268 RepID=UPI00203DD977|nr:site-specific integrase [Metabacillus litoralis]MCM3161021.1 site-specific integrase [Metabacillus litoralis]
MEKEKIFNEELKLKFLSEYESEKTRSIYNYLFLKSGDLEDVMNIDLSQFNLKQIEKLLKEIKPLTINVARSNGRIISAYINWAVKVGIRNNPNPLKEVGNEWFDQFVDKESKLYLSSEDIDGLEKQLVNAQDAVILYLIFEGVFGEALSELLNLSINDIDFDNNVLFLQDDFSNKRELKVTSQCIRIIRQAMSEKEYHGRNGEGRTVKLVDNEFIIRSADTRSTSPGKANRHLVYRRITTVSEHFDYPYLTAKSIQKSGMIKMGRDLFIKHGTLGKDQLYEIAKRFNVNTIKVKEYEYYNSTLLSSFVNLENINDLYGSDF